MQKATDICSSESKSDDSISLPSSQEGRQSFFSIFFCSWGSAFSTLSPSPKLQRRVSVASSLNFTQKHLLNSANVQIRERWKNSLSLPLQESYQPFFLFLQEKEELLSPFVISYFNALFYDPEEHAKSTLPLLAFIAIQEIDTLELLCERADSLAELSKTAKKWVEDRWQLFLECFETSRFQISTSYQMDFQEIYSARYPVAVADFLLLPKAELFLPFIPYFIEQCLCQSSKNSTQNHVLNNLRFAESSLSLQFFMKQLHVFDTNSNTESIIKAWLGKEIDSQLTHRDLTLAYFSTFLTNIRQLESGSCFATSLGILLCNEKPSLFAKDLKELLQTGRLTRHLGNQKLEFPYLLPLKHKELEKSIAIPGNDLLTHPALCRLSRALGERRKHAFDEALAELSNQGLFTPKDLISRLFDILKDQGLEEERLKVYLAWSYLSTFQNPLLLCWESSVAEMAEAKELGMVMRPVLYSIIRPVERWLESHLIFQETICASLKIVLQKRTRVLWDPAVFCTKVGSKEYLQGGFILYDNNKFSWIRLDTEELFRAFVSSLVEEVLRNISTVSDEKKSDLIAYLRSADFSKDALIQYNPACQQGVEEGKIETERILYAPWRTISGNIAENVLDVYFEEKGLFPMRFQVSSIETLFQTLISLAPKIQIERGKSIHRCLGSVAKHAFTTIFQFENHLSLDKVNQNPQKYLRKIKKCFNRFQATPLSSSWKEKVLREIVEKLPDFLKERLIPFPPFSDRDTFVVFFDQIRVHLKEHFSQQNGSNIETLLKKIFIENLPRELSSLLQSCALIFADSNWSQSGQNLYFCFSCDPFRNNLGIYEVTEDFSHFSLLLSEDLTYTNWTITQIIS